VRNKAIQVRLNEWAEWVRTARHAGGPKLIRSWWAPMVTEPHMGSGASSGRLLHEPINDERAEQTDSLVKDLPPHERLVIWNHYINGGTPEQKANACGVSKTSFYRHLEEAEAVFETILHPPKVYAETYLRRGNAI
jgi:DNA-directed RNA polymerase specialized sigma24 family protein